MPHSVKLVRTLHERLKIIEEVEKNPSEKRIDIAKRLGLAPSTLNSIIAKKKEIRKQIDKCGNVSKKRKTGRESTFIELERVLFTWHQEARGSNIHVDGNMLRAKAKEIAARLNIGNFAASNGWITRFKKRHGMVCKKELCESAALDREPTDLWIERLPTLLEGYEPRDIYSADEAGLFYNVLPDKTSILKGVTCHRGQNAINRITVLLCVNSDASDKQVPIVVGKSLKPRCFKNIRKLPVQYHANRKAWMTTGIFTTFLKSLDASMGAQDRKILLFVDSCAAHPQDITFLKNVKVVQYPANNINVLQPFNLGIIKSFKQFYRKSLVQIAVCLMDAGKDLDMKVDLLQAIHYTVAAWRQVSQPTVVNCFRKGGYGCELRAENDSKIIVGEDEDDDAFHKDWLRFGTMVEFCEYASVDNELAICRVDEMCEDREGGGSILERDEKDECEFKAVPNFSEAHAALMKVKSFLCAHNISDRDEENILNLEMALFGLKNKGLPSNGKILNNAVSISNDPSTSNSQSENNKKRKIDNVKNITQTGKNCRKTAVIKNNVHQNMKVEQISEEFIIKDEICDEDYSNNRNRPPYETFNGDINLQEKAMSNKDEPSSNLIYRTHFMSDVEKMTHTCEFCSATFSYKAELDVHIQTHTKGGHFAEVLLPAIEIENFKSELEDFEFK